MKTLTIITINYNNLHGLKKTMESVELFKEKSNDIEYIIVDGSSVDGSIDYVKNNLHFVDVFINESDHGIYDAMNKGIDRASGDFVIFMNSGDRFHYDFKFSDYVNALYSNDGNDSDKIIYGDVLHSVDDIFFKYVSISDSSDKWWMKGTPCHQSLFLPTWFVKKNKFSSRYGIYADAEQMIKAFNELSIKIKISKAISIFEIGGACSSACGGFKYFLANNLKHQEIYNKKCGVFFLFKTILRYFLLIILGGKKYYILSAVISLMKNLK